MDITTLRTQIDQICQKFIDPEIEKQKLDPFGFNPDLQMIAAFRLLAHAEIEAFLEEKARRSLAELERQLVDVSHSRELSHLIAISLHVEQHKKYSDIRDNAELLDFKGLVINKARELVNKNNGIKAPSFLMVAIFCGLHPSSIDEVLSAELNTFGSARGDVAHVPAIRVSDISAPDDEKQKLLRLLDCLNNQHL